MVVEWDRPLAHRQGSPHRLDGIDVYYDFDWFEFFPDARAQFRNGRCMALLVRDDCPDGKTPALLLTTRDEVKEAPIETETHYVVVLNLPRYLSLATGDAAASYFAHGPRAVDTRITQLHTLAAQPEVISAVVDRELDLQHIAAWASSRADGIEQLRSIAGVSQTDAERESNLPTALSALQTLGHIDPEIADALESLLRRDVQGEIRLRLLRALTDDASGRYATAELLGQRIAERLDDARGVTEQYSALLEEGSTETELQRFIESNPWLLGLDYVQVRPRRALPRGEMDFILERYDGFHDLLELKSPQDQIIIAPNAVDGVPPSASAFSLSPDLSVALAQVHVYRDVLSQAPEILDEQYGLPSTIDPRVIIVIGQVGPLPDHRKRVLRALNLSLHRVEVVPYDVLAQRARTILDNVERHLTESGSTSGR